MIKYQKSRDSFIPPLTGLKAVRVDTEQGDTLLKGIAGLRPFSS